MPAPDQRPSATTTPPSNADARRDALDARVAGLVRDTVTGAPLVANRFRGAWAGTIGEGQVGETLRVAGWVHRRRDHGGLIFVDLRDRTGLLQVVFDPDTSGPEVFAAAERLRSEHVISVQGVLAARGAEHVNPRMETGAVELRVAEIDVLAEAETPPFAVDEDGDVDELLRLKRRVIDLRRERNRDALLLRSRIVREIRSALDEEGFLDIETPMLTRSTPEGARDFLVPSRLQPGSFYALPQSPQLFKQLFMIAGLERYYQIVRCFRDEDLRADRQPEFTQLDAELSFVDEDDVIAVFERVMARAFAAGGLDVAAPAWERMGYDEALLRFGNDRPDRRFGLEIQELSEALSTTEFKVFAGTLASGGVVRGINAGGLTVPRKQLDELTEIAKKAGAGGLVWGFVEEDGSWRSPIAKFLTPEEIEAIKGTLSASPGDLLLIVADKAPTAANVLGTLRLELADRFDLREDRNDVLWIVDFPMFEHDAGEDRWDAIHHPFTQPCAPGGAAVTADELRPGGTYGPGGAEGPGALHSRAYDLVVNGWEVGGGSIRVNRIEQQQAILELLGFTPDDAQERFGFLLDALKAGAPPHGGIAFGIDRLAALCAGRDSLRDVIAFPKTASGGDPLTGAPAPVDATQLRDVGLRSTVEAAPAG
ncbi:Aspartyl-tRNA synthetase [Patulibacter medicamentivorans]|uniref:Aspartate--tRNA(Asp/Asn) ligase n=1 Tax=Patulibacter medicamentivorans TaxID=1097667 RepID=H0EBB4_9ACTN|nr:aspartate--tRNA ligase [Patulibacter medicamentivorans]EHN08990.1 Aspartyl-tRNA synthetase [Patulibacter medicamentivorans]